MTRIPRRRRRAGYTLIELLVVMSIIALLTGLALAGVLAARDSMLRTDTKTDINKMVDGLEVARKSYHDLPFFPSRLILYNDVSTYRTLTGVPAADQPTVKRTAEVLKYMFGRTFINKATTVAWDTSGPTGRVVLNGPECLVFYLGGMPDTANGACLGFSTQPLNPTAAGGERIGPFFNFKSNRLELGASGKFFRYKDPYGTVYAFFGLLGAKNSYDPTESTEPAGLAPYVEPNGTYLAPDTYQIISAGKDRTFGSGGTWNPSQGSSVGGTRDNIANFSRGALGGPRE